MSNFKLNSYYGVFKYLVSHPPLTATVLQMTDHVYRRFPDNIKSIQALIKKDSTFREICDDYDEICNWLTSHDRSEHRPSKEYDHAREMARNLEDEIKIALKEHGF